MADQVRVDVPPPFDKAYVTITSGGEPVAQVSLEAVELEELIANLGRGRSHLRDQVPSKLEPNQRSEAVADPIWQVNVPPGLPFEGRALFLRHPGRLALIRTASKRGRSDGRSFEARTLS